MHDTKWNTLLSEAQAAHETHPALQAFCPFPTEINPKAFTPHHINAARLMETDSGLTSQAPHDAFRDAFVACSPTAPWRETYKNTNIGSDFLDQFGCYELIGDGGAFATQNMRSFVVYAPPGLYYPWHHHPAEELYLVIAGEAEFMAEGKQTNILHPGDTAFHATNQPHAMATHDHPVMAYVLWRGDLTTAPVLTETPFS